MKAFKNSNVEVRSNFKTKSAKAYFNFFLILGAVLAVSGLGPTFAEANGCGQDGVYGQATIQFVPENSLDFVKRGTNSALLCDDIDQTATGGGSITFIYDANFILPGPCPALELGTEMNFWFDPVSWLDIASGNLLFIRGNYHPIGKFRQHLLDLEKEGKDCKAEDWNMQFNYVPETNGYDFDNDGNIDLRIQVQIND